MHAAHIAVFSIPSRSRVNASLEIIRELVARGHRVTYAIPEDFAETVASTGAEPKPYVSLHNDRDPTAWGKELIDNFEILLENAIRELPQMADAYEGDEPDLILHDIASQPARVLAHRWGVPIVHLAPSMVPWKGYEEEAMEPLTWPRETPRVQAYYERFTKWLISQGVTVHPDDFSRPERCIVLFPKAMQPNADRVDETVYTFVGPCLGNHAHRGGWRRPADAEKVLLVSLGSIFTQQPGFYRTCIEAFGGLTGWHVVLQIGKHVAADELGVIPPNIEVHDWVPQLAVLKQADAFITHAGMGGSREGLACGVPMVAVPQTLDQFANADMLQALGVARHVPMAKATAEALREAVLGMTCNPEVAARSAAIRQQIAAEGGTRRAADLIERELWA